VLRTCFDVAPAGGHPAKTKTAGIRLPFTILLSFLKETRGEREGLPENGRSPHWAKRKNCLFWRAGCPPAGAWDLCSLREIHCFLNRLKIHHHFPLYHQWFYIFPSFFIKLLTLPVRERRIQIPGGGHPPMFVPFFPLLERTAQLPTKKHRPRGR